MNLGVWYQLNEARDLYICVDKKIENALCDF